MSTVTSEMTNQHAGHWAQFVFTSPRVTGYSTPRPSAALQNVASKRLSGNKFFLIIFCFKADASCQIVFVSYSQILTGFTAGHISLYYVTAVDVLLHQICVHPPNIYIYLMFHIT